MLAAFRAAVPKASVDKENDLFSGENQIRVSEKTYASYGLVTPVSEVPKSSMPQRRG